MTPPGTRSSTGDDLRVAVVFGTFPPERNGGADFVARFAPALADLGATVHVVTSPSPGAPEREQTGPGVTVHRIVDDWTLSRRGRRNLREVDELLAAETIDVLHVLFPDSVIQARYQLPAAIGFGRIPLVTTFWNLGVGRRSPLPIKLEALGLAARSAVVSSHDPAYLHALRLGLGRARPVRWLPVGSNLDGAGTSRGTRSENEPTLAYFGHLDFTRGVDDLFAALAELRRDGDVHLVMVGGAARGERVFRKLSQELGVADAVRWTGYLPAPDAAATLAGVDLCVLPYRRASLGRSALAAALEVGVPTVLAGTPEGVAPLRPGAHVALVPPGDVVTLTATIRRLLDDERGRADLAAGAQRASRLFAWPRIAAGALSIYAEAGRKAGADR